MRAGQPAADLRSSPRPTAASHLAVVATHSSDVRGDKEFLFLTPQHANNTRYPDFTLHRARRDSRRSGYAGRSPRRTTRIRPGRAGDRWIERDERTPRGFGLRGGRTEGPNVSTIERIGYRTYRSADGAAPAAGSRTVSASDVPPGAARWRPGAPRARAWRGNVMRGKRAMRLRMCDPADVRPDTPTSDRTTRPGKLTRPIGRGMSSRLRRQIHHLGQTHELPRTSEGTTVYVLLIITCPVALQPDDPHIAAPSARTAARQQ